MKPAGLFAIFLVAVLLALGVTAEAQQPTKVARIGYVSGSGDPKTPGPLVEGFRQGLRTARIAADPLSIRHGNLLNAHPLKPRA